MDPVTKAKGAQRSPGQRSQWDATTRGRNPPQVQQLLQHFGQRCASLRPSLRIVHRELQTGTLRPECLAATAAGRGGGGGGARQSSAQSSGAKVAGAAPGLRKEGGADETLARTTETSPAQPAAMRARTCLRHQRCAAPR